MTDHDHDHDHDAVREEDILAVCLAVGFITVNWALVEHQLDNCVALVMKHFEDVHRKKIPRQYAVKAEFLRTAFSAISQLKNFKAPMHALLDRTDSAADKRHVFIHGTIDKFQGVNLSMSKLGYDAGLLAKAKSTFDLSESGDVIPEFVTLSTDWLNFAVCFHDAASAALHRQRAEKRKT